MKNIRKEIPVKLFADEALKSLGMNLYMLRHNKGLSLQEFSQAVNEPISVLEKMELGLYDTNEKLDFDILIKLISFHHAHIEMNLF